MSCKRWNTALLILATAGFAACSKDDDKGGNQDPYGQRQIDLSNFKNTASSSELAQRGDDVNGYFTELADVRHSFMIPAVGADLSNLQELDADELEDQPDASVPTASALIPEFDSIYDCGSAFGAFEQTYAGVQAEFNAIYGMLLKPTRLNLVGTDLDGHGQLKTVAPDDQSAVAYALVAPEQTSLKMQGSIRGGADADVMVIRQDLDLSINGLAMRVGESIAVDTARKLIEMDTDTSMTSKDAGESSTTLNVKGRVAVSAGTDKFVTMSLDLAHNGDGQSNSAHIDMETRLVDANTLTYRATLRAQDSQQNDHLAFTVTRSAPGQCTVQQTN